MKELHLENFRCYSEQSFSFKPGINLLIGDNASGKTSVLKACKYVLSAFFAGFSDENTKWISPDSSDFHETVIDGEVLPEKPISIKFKLSSDMDIPSDMTIIKGAAWQELRKNTRKNSRALTSGIATYKTYARSYYKHIDNGTPWALPVFASFTTEDIHTNRKIKANAFLRYTQKRSFGYYECLNGNGLFPYWIKRLLVLQEGNKQLDEIETVRQSIILALGKDGCDIIYDMQVRPIQRKVYFIFKDGREVEVEQLSDGYRRLVSIVTDIAFRCAILGQMSKTKPMSFVDNKGNTYDLNFPLRKPQTIVSTKGTVLIDEIDLHLHPSVQATVLKGLKNAFPNIQFIVTTHAPMVMSGVESNGDNVVYQLNYSEKEGYTHHEAQTYGMDMSTITEIVLQQVPREQTVELQLERLFELIDSEKEADARQLLKEMQTKFGNALPELSRAEAMLNFIIDG